MTFDGIRKIGNYVGKGVGGVATVGGLLHKSPKKAGAPPGTMVFVGERKTEHATVSVIDYDETRIHEAPVNRIEEAFAFKETETTTWINVTGLHDTELIGKIGGHFGLHALVLEDIVNTNQRPKMEDFGDYLFIVAKMLYIDEATGETATEQISLIFGEHYVMTFQEVEKDVFAPLRTRIRNAGGRIRKRGPDYLLYAILDSIVDHYFIVLEHIGEQIEGIEEELGEAQEQGTMARIRGLKTQALLIRKSVWPLREIIGKLDGDDVKLISESTSPFLRDVYDHTIQTIDTVETFRDMLSGLSDLYMSSISNKMNEVMKVLTIIATIFIPLTFLAGVYGMNFKYIPELGWRWSYPVFWCTLIVVGLGMVAYFRKKKWL